MARPAPRATSATPKSPDPSAWPAFLLSQVGGTPRAVSRTTGARWGSSLRTLASSGR